MMTTSTIAALVGLTLACPQMGRAAGVVTVCNEAGLKAALLGGGTVMFACNGTITVLGGTIVISQHTVIDGTGHKITISGGFKVQVFLVNSSGALFLTNITVANGSSPVSGGGGLENDNGFVEITNCTFQDNAGFEFGGGIYNNSGDLAISGSTFTGNNSNSGSAVYVNHGYVIIDGTTFYNNLSAQDSGGALYNKGPILQVTNSTFLGNPNGGNFVNEGGAVFINTTLASGPGQAYNLQNNKYLLLQNTILRGGPGVMNCTGFSSVTDGGGNLRWPASDSSCVGSYGDPKLGPLQNNGGPTQTMALLTGSAAIDTGADVNCTWNDQRGVIRPQGPHCDIGSYEVATARSLGIGVNAQLNGFLPSLASLDAMRSLSNRVIGPLENSLNPNLWPPCPTISQCDGNHINSQNGNQVFTNQRNVVDTLTQNLVDPTQLVYINNLVMAARTLAVVALQDKGCVTNPTPGVVASSQVCAQAVADIAAGDADATNGNFSQAITRYMVAWQLITP